LGQTWVCFSSIRLLPHEFALTFVDILVAQRRPKRILDLFIKVRLHPAIQIGTLRSVVAKVFTQTLPLLRRRAGVWLLGTRGQVRVVVLVCIPGVIPKKYKASRGDTSGAKDAKENVLLVK